MAGREGRHRRLVMTFTFTAILMVTQLGAGPVAANSPPVAEAGDNQHVKVGDIVIFGGSDSYDPDGDNLAYSWDFDASDGIQEESILMAPRTTYTRAGIYTVTLTVSDGMATHSDTIIVEVEPNLPPTVDLGPDATIGVNEWFYPDARNTTDPNGDPLSYSWDFDASDGIGEDSTEGLARWMYSRPGRFTITLTVSDGEFTANGTMNVTVEQGFVKVSKKHDEDNTLGPGQKRAYIVSLNRNTGLNVNANVRDSKVLTFFLMRSKDYYDYCKTGTMMVIKQGTKENVTKVNYGVKVSATDDYVIVVQNPDTTPAVGNETRDVAYNIKIWKTNLDTPGLTGVEALVGIVLAAVAVVVVRRRIG